MDKQMVTTWYEKTEGKHPHRVVFGLPDRVDINNHEAIEFSVHRTSIPWKLTLAAMDWLSEAGCEYKFKTRRGYWYKNARYAATISVCFADKDMATLFKVTWA